MEGLRGHRGRAGGRLVWPEGRGSTLGWAAARNHSQSPLPWACHTPHTLTDVLHLPRRVPRPLG